MNASAPALGSPTVEKVRRERRDHLMTVDEDRLEHVRGLIGTEPVVGTGRTGVALALHQLCCAAVRVLPASGAAVSLMTPAGPAGIVAAYDESSRVVEELQFVLGEGPSWDAFESHAPVLAPSMQGESARRWPGYAAEVGEHGIQAVFAFPLQVGAAPMGVLDLFRREPGDLGGESLATASAFAAVATATLLDGQEQAGAGQTPKGVDDALASRLAVYQAQGMVMVQLALPLPQAMSRLRAYAYLHGRSLSQVTSDIVARRVNLERDGH